MAIIEPYLDEEELRKKQQEQQQANNAPAIQSVSSNSVQPTTPTVTAPTVKHAASSIYDPNADEAYMQALQTLNAHKNNKPIYANSYEAQLEDLYKQITGREDFKYDVSDDMLYQQYKNQYINMGKLAMEDSMGQAAALTGGYGSSYSQNVGQQQYNAYLQQLNEVVPELYGMAYQRYQDEGDALLNRYGLLGDLADEEYGKYQDALSEYWQGMSYLQGQADDAYNRGLAQAENDYAKKQDAYDQLVELMTGIGYIPSDEELAAAGMSAEQAAAYRNYYYMQNPAAVSSSSGGGGGSSGGGGGSSGPKATPQSTDPTISNNHGDSWVQVSGLGRVSYQELESYVNDGTVKETVSADGTKVTYTPNRTGNSNNNTSSGSGGNKSSSSNKAAVTDVTGTANIGPAVSDLWNKLTKKK